MGIVRYLISKPLLTKLILVFIAGLAASSIMRLQRQGYPRVDLEKMRITTYYPGASPEDVEKNVTIKLEEALKEVDGIDKYISTSLENYSRIEIFIDSDAEDKEKVKTDVRRSIDSVNDLPIEVEEKPDIFEVKVDNFSIYEVALAMPKGHEKELRNHAKNLKKKLLEISSVSKVNESAVRDREIKILLDRRALEKHYISFDEVLDAIKQNKLRLSGGSLESYTSEKGIVTFSEFEKPEDVENIIIRASDLGYKIRIKDVGRVIDDFEKKNTIIKYNGERGMSLWVAKKGNADIISTVDEIKEKIRLYQASVDKNNQPVHTLSDLAQMYVDETLPPEIQYNLKIFSTFDDSIQTKHRLSIVINNALLGFLIVLLILFVFLDRHSALYTSLGIPISIALTIIIMPLLGITLNSISILGLIVVLGMVVDDAIIIAESVYRAREEGMPAKEAAVYGLKIVFKPVFGTIVTTIIAFIPIYYLPGQMGQFSVEIPSVVIIMLLASLIEASTLLPAHLSHIDESTLLKKKDPPGSRLISKLENVYAKVLQWSLVRKYITFSFFVAFLVVGYVISILITDFDMFPIDQAVKMSVYGDTEQGSSLENTLREVEDIEDLIEKLPAGVVHSYKTVVGETFKTRLNSSNSFYINLILTQATKRKLKASDVKEFIQKGAKLSSLNFFIDSGGPKVGNPLEIQLIGNDNDQRKKAIDAVMADLHKLPLTEIDNDLKDGKEEYRLLPNYENIAQAQLSVSAIASTIRTAFDGTIVTYLQTPDEKVPFRVILDEKSKDFKEPLKGLYVRNGQARLVPIKELVNVTSGFATDNIYHYKGERTNLITANIVRGETNAKAIYEMLEKKYRHFSKSHPGIKIVLAGEAEESSKTFIHIITSLIAAIIAIYFLLVLQFDSFTQPVMVILAIPFGLVGITLAFGLHGIPLSMLALIGVLGFSGVVVNDSLIMVDFINRLVKGFQTNEPAITKKPKKHRRIDDSNNFNAAIIQGAKLRLRPIVLTTVTTMGGLVPTAYGIIGGTDSFISPMVLAMAWGLLVGTTSVLVIIPVLYAIFNDLSSLTLAKFAGRRQND